MSQGQPVTFMFQCSSESTNVSIYLQSAKIIQNHIKQNKIKNELGPQVGVLVCMIIRVLQTYLQG